MIKAPEFLGRETLRYSLGEMGVKSRRAIRVGKHAAESKEGKGVKDAPKKIPDNFFKSLWRSRRGGLNLTNWKFRAIATDVHFWIPLAVLFLGTLLLAAMR